MALVSVSPKMEGGKFRRPTHFQTQLYSDILLNQQTDNGDLADALLICDGGNIRVHTFIVQMASPFLRSIFESQGHNFPYIREVLLPDFPVDYIHQMLDLIYKGQVNLRSEEEMIRLQDTLSFFGVSCDASIVSSKPEEEAMITIPGSLKVHLLNRIPPDICNPASDSKAVDENGGGDGTYLPPTPTIEIRKSPAVKNNDQDVEYPEEDKPQSEVKAHQTGKEIKPEVDGTDVNEEGSMFARIKKRRASTSKKAPLKTEKQPVVKLPRMRTRNQQSQNAPPLVPAPVEIQDPPRPSSQPHVLQQQQPEPPVSSEISSITLEPETPDAATGAPALKEEEEEEICSSSEDEGWQLPNYKDKKWFLRESHRCQACNKIHQTSLDASVCFATHKDVLRCYFCFKLYTSTKVLVRHFEKRHQKAPGKDGSIVCPYCDQEIPFNSASVHVITQHLIPLKNEIMGKGGSGHESKFCGEEVGKLSSSCGNGERPGRSVTESQESLQARIKGKRRVKSNTPVLELEDSSMTLVSSSSSERKKRRATLTFAKMNKMMKKGGGVGEEKEEDKENARDDEVEG